MLAPSRSVPLGTGRPQHRAPGPRKKGPCGPRGREGGGVGGALRTRGPPAPVRGRAPTLFLTTYGEAFKPDVVTRQIAAWIKAAGSTKRARVICCGTRASAWSSSSRSREPCADSPRSPRTPHGPDPAGRALFAHGARGKDKLNATAGHHPRRIVPLVPMLRRNIHYPDKQTLR